MRKIIHIDMDAFYASVEMRDNPSLQNRPIAVGGASDRRGVLCTANYEARKYGVRSAMPTAHARKLCPQLILVKPNFRKYSQASKEVFKIFQDYTDQIEPLSLDEAYLDVTEAENCFNSATWMAQEIRSRISKKLELPASAGISSNKLIAKMASDYNKPNGQFTVSPWEIETFIKNVPIEKLWGIGKVTAQKLHEMEIRNCEDLQRFSRQELIHYMGKFGNQLYDFCRGEDNREVETEWERKSVGNEETFREDISDLEEMKIITIRLVEELKETLGHYEERTIKNLHVKIKYFDFKQTTIERQIPFSEQNFLSLLEERWGQDPRPVRLIGVGIKFVEGKNDHFQLPLLTELTG